MSDTRGRILLVEDTPTQAEVAKALLADLGHEVRHAANGTDGLRMALEWQPDAILVDLQLPDFSGFDLMRKLRAQGSRAVLIVLTANGSVDAAVEAMRLGAMDFIVKPYGKARLKVTLDNALEKRALRAELVQVRTQLQTTARRHTEQRNTIRYLIGCLVFLAGVMALFILAGF